MFEFDKDIAAELAMETKSVANPADKVPTEDSASLDDFKDDGTFVPAYDPEAEDDDFEDISDEDEEAFEAEDQQEYKDSARFVTDMLAIGQKTLFVKWIKKRRKNTFTDDELVRIARIKAAENIEISERDTAILARWENIQELIDDADMPEEIKEYHVVVLTEILRRTKTKVDPVTIAGFQLLMYYTLKAVAVFGIKRPAEQAPTQQAQAA